MSAPMFWFWQNSPSPHMVGLAVELSFRGHAVVYVCETRVRPERVHLGWGDLPESAVQFHLELSIPEAITLAKNQPSGSINLIEGIRSSSFLIACSKALETRGACVLPMLEQWDWRGVRGICRGILYASHVKERAKSWAAVLSIGSATPRLLRKAGVRNAQIVPFAYFLSVSPRPPIADKDPPPSVEGAVNLVFVGNVIKRKGLDILLAALSDLSHLDWRLTIIGEGPERKLLEAKAGAFIRGRLEWFGLKTGSCVYQAMESSDCLVLPSRFDGWGAVVSESLQVGTPVVSSDACGASEIVRASGYGGVFISGSKESLKEALRLQILKGKVRRVDRQNLAAWAGCLKPACGADYLCSVLSSLQSSRQLPPVPWHHSCGS